MAEQNYNQRKSHVMGEHFFAKLSLAQVVI